MITAADVPYQRPIGVAKDHLPLKGDRVRSLRDEIAAVAADSEEIAGRGAAPDRGRVRGPAAADRSAPTR